MDFHRPPPCAARARRAPVWQRSLGVVLVAGMAALGCSSATEDAGDLTDELPTELAADGAETDTATGDGDAAADGDLDGFGPIEDVDFEPTESAAVETVELTGEDPAEVIEEVAEEIAAADDDADLLDALEPVDDAGEAPGEPDGRTRNGSGELVELDVEASLACANIEIAIGQLDGGFLAQAGELVRSGAAQAEASGIAEIRSWAQPLRAAADAVNDPAPLVGFLSVCTEGGYEL